MLRAKAYPAEHACRKQPGDHLPSRLGVVFQLGDRLFRSPKGFADHLVRFSGFGTFGRLELKAMGR